jgi:DNA segregation ATPase FtsK/SpoIIIE, S-DNA-T family
MAGKPSGSKKPAAKKESKPRTTLERKLSAPKAGSRKPVDKLAASKNGPRFSARKPARSGGSKRSKSPAWEGLSLDQKLDVIGVILVVIGLLTLLSFLSTNRSSLTGAWALLVGQAFGIGMYLVPFGLIAVGLWLVLRNFERIPQMALERVLGVVLLFFNLLAAAHLIAFARSQTDLFLLAQEAQGGGYVGAVMLNVMLAALGRGGAIIALSAWFLIGAALALDKTLGEMFRWAPPLFDRVGQSFSRLAEARQARREAQSGLPNGFTPLIVEQDLDQTHPIPPQVIPPGGDGPYAHIGIASEERTWVLPAVEDILDPGGDVSYDDEIDRHRAQVIEETLASFGAPANVVEINRGPTITQFGVEPDFVDSRGGRMRVRVSKITALADDLALALSARTIRIQAPVPGKGFIGIEVPNDQVALVAQRDVIESDAFKRLTSPLRFALGQNVAGMAVAADLAAMPHLLIAGSTGSGKSVCVNALISCLLLNNTPDDLRLIMVDPKRVELTGYNGIPHLLAPVVVEMERVVAALQWVTREMDMRYRKLAEAGARNIKDYNARIAARGGIRLPYLVVIIDELADLMMLAPDETERTITRLAQLARATGIHLVIATQRPSVDVVTGLIKANFPARVAFAVASGVDSRVILDQPGAERLLGRGDMLFQAPDAPAPVRLQGVFVSENEIQRLVQYWQGFAGEADTMPIAVGGIVDQMPSNIPLKQLPMWDEVTEERDPLLIESIDLVRRQGRASISMLQRRFRIGYTRAARLIEEMEEKGIIGPPVGATGAREVLDYGQAAPPVDEMRD